MATLEIRIDSSGDDGVPHVFIFLIDKFGNESAYGFAPVRHLDLWGPGRVYNDLDHEWDRVIPLEITDQQLLDIEAYVNYRKMYPQIYEGWDNNCVKFVYNALFAGGVAVNAEYKPMLHPVQAYWDIAGFSPLQRIADMFGLAQRFAPPRRPPRA